MDLVILYYYHDYPRLCILYLSIKYDILLGLPGNL